jgi:hypothetical protein
MSANDESVEVAGQESQPEARDDIKYVLITDSEGKMVAHAHSPYARFDDEMTNAFIAGARSISAHVFAGTNTPGDLRSLSVGKHLNLSYHSCQDAGGKVFTLALVYDRKLKPKDLALYVERIIKAVAEAPDAKSIHEDMLKNLAFAKLGTDEHIKRYGEAFAKQSEKTASKP